MTVFDTSRQLIDAFRYLNFWRFAPYVSGALHRLLIFAALRLTALLGFTRYLGSILGDFESLGILTRFNLKQDGEKHDFSNFVL